MADEQRSGRQDVADVLEDRVVPPDEHVQPGALVAPTTVLRNDGVRGPWSRPPAASPFGYTRRWPPSADMAASTATLFEPDNPGVAARGLGLLETPQSCDGFVDLGNKLSGPL